MTATLLRRFHSLLWLLVLLGGLLGGAQSARASHLLGGEMTYRYLDANGPSTAPYRYEVTTSVYVSCSNSNTQPYLDLTVFDKTTGTYLSVTSANLGSGNATLSPVYSGGLRLAQSSIGACATIAVPVGCTITGASQPYQLQKFVGVICLPASSAGFYVLTTPSGARNAGINNLAGGASSGYTLGLFSTLTPPTIPNSSPVFTGEAVGLICAGDTTVVLNNAVDADGDRLVYAFGQPYTGAASTTMAIPPPPYVPYTTAGGYSAATPLGTGAGYYAKIDANTGITKYLGGPTVGNRYGVAVDVTEYRTINGVEVSLGTTRRDIQLLVGSCPATAPPILPTVAVLPRAYTIEAGSTLRIPITGTQSASHPLTLTATSALLSSSSYNATFAGNAGTPTYAGSPVGAYTVAGTVGGTVAGTFAFTPTCTQARATPYDVTLVLQDVGCAGKLTSDVLRITVTKPTGPTTIAGSLSVCGLNTLQTYTASGGTAPGVRWTATGGTIVGSATANPVTVRWVTAGAGTLTAQGVAQYGCLVDQVTKTVTVSPTPVLTIAGNLTICQGDSTILTVTGGGTPPYRLVGGATPLTGAGTFVLSPTQTTTYTLSPAVGPASGCPATGQVTVTVVPRPVANAGAAVSFCAGGTAQLGVAPVAGTTYSWSPATGLSSATSANPTVTLTNPTSAATTQPYTLTATTSGGCAATSTVAVTVQPALVPGTIGADQTVCVGAAPAPLTSMAAAAGGPGTYTYQWESSPDNSTWTALAHASSLTYAPGPVAATTYFRRSVAAGTCGAAYSNVVTVQIQPLLVPAVALAVPPAQCAGTAYTFVPVPTNAGAAPTYQWFVNGAAVATGATYTSATLADGDAVQVALTPTAGFCASGSATATVRVRLVPISTPTAAIFLQTTLPACAGTPITFGLGQATTTGPGSQYQWQVDGVNVAGATSPSFTSTTLRDGQAVTLLLRTTNACGQPATATSTAVRVAINQAVQVSAGPDKTIMEGETVVLEGTADGSYPVGWSPAQTLTFGSGSQLRPVAAPLATTTYTLAAGAGYCGSSLVTVTVLPRVRIPNAFSPNGDNDDDTWQIDNIGQYPNNRVVVFDRWGAKIFETAHYGRTSEWQGTINGQPAPFGTYYYLITLGNGKSYTGPLTVIH